jgi:hypothetical protein
METPDEKILAGEPPKPPPQEPVLGGEAGAGNGNGHAGSPTRAATTLRERIAASTRAGGLRRVPEGFDEQGGDWGVVTSANPFEVLYLDYRQYKLITPALVQGNYAVMQQFWRDKVTIMNTGGNRAKFKSKYGEGTVEHSLTRLEQAFEKLRTPAGIETYYREVNDRRLHEGEARLESSIEDMLVGGEAHPAAIKLRLDRGEKYDLSPDETASIVKKYLDKNGFKPYGDPRGNGLREQLLSVPWMTEERIAYWKAQEAEKLKHGREIFPGVYAYSTEDIGGLLFRHEAKAKEYIGKGLVVNAIDYFSSAKAWQVSEIIAQQRDEHLRYLQIVYRLNPGLPYRFRESEVKEVEEVAALFVHNQKLAREHFKHGNLEIWLLETRRAVYDLLTRIRDSAENVHLALLEFIYTINPALPYVFAGTQPLHTPFELFAAINANAGNWESGKAELLDGSIPTWLRIIGAPAGAGERPPPPFSDNPDALLEDFLHGLVPETQYPRIAADPPSVAYPGIQSGSVVTADLVFTSTGRGYAAGKLSLADNLPGVSLSAEAIFFNAAAGTTRVPVSLRIDSGALRKGVAYRTAVVLDTSARQRIEIPVAFQVVFPRNRFILENVKYAALLAVFFGLVRYLVAADYPAWLHTYFNFYLDFDGAYASAGRFALFGWAFFLFFLGIAFGTYHLLRYYFKKG